MSAKADTTADAASADTPKESAKIGIDGMTIPKPSATKKAMLARTATSTGRSLSKGRRLRTILEPTQRRRDEVARPGGMTGHGRQAVRRRPRRERT